LLSNVCDVLTAQLTPQPLLWSLAPERQAGVKAMRLEVSQGSSVWKLQSTSLR